MEAAYIERAVEVRTAYVILLLLAKGPRTGYELIKEIKDLFSDIGISASPGTVYPLLRRLEEEGYLESREEPHGGRQRKVYIITERGTEFLLRSAQKALRALESAMKLHLNVVRNISSREGVPPKLRPLLDEILVRLESIERIARELAQITRQFRESG